MSESDPKTPPGAAKDLKDKDLNPREKTSGRVAFDSRGNAVWEWKMKTGVFGRDVDTGKLRTLEAKDLEIAEDPKAEPATGQQRQKAARVARQSGFDPYNSSTPPGKATPPAAAPAHRPPEKEEKPGLLKRLFGKR